MNEKNAEMTVKKAGNRCEKNGKKTGSLAGKNFKNGLLSMGNFREIFAGFWVFRGKFFEIIQFSVKKILKNMIFETKKRKRRQKWIAIKATLSIFSMKLMRTQ